MRQARHRRVPAREQRQAGELRAGEGRCGAKGRKKKKEEAGKREQRRQRGGVSPLSTSSSSSSLLPLLLLPLLPLDSNNDVETLLGIFDLRGFGPRNADLSFARFLVDACFLYYPRRLGAVLFVDAPWAFKPVWAVVKPLLRKYGALVRFVSAEEVKQRLFRGGRSAARVLRRVFFTLPPPRSSFSFVSFIRSFFL